MKYEINLLPQREQNIIDRMIYFSFHYLRYILVLTQLVVIIVFFTRLKLDQEIIDMKDSLSQKQEIVAVSKPLVAQAATIDRKVNQTEAVVQIQQNTQGMFTYFTQTFPKGLILNSFEMNKGSIQMSGFTIDPNIVKQYYLRLKSDAKFSKVNLNDIKKTDTDFEFSFSLADFKGK